MGVEQFDNLVKAQPFEPFTVHVAEAQAFYVPHPEFVWRTPHGGTLYVATESGKAANIIRMDHVTRLEPGVRSRSKKTGKRKQG